MKYLHDKSRLQSISDGMFAFAATLIVVSLEVPKSFQDLESMLTNLLSFALSFFALVLIWITHYNYFRKIKKIDYIIIILNFILLFVLLLYVYPLKFLSNLSIGATDKINLSQFAKLWIWYGAGFVIMFITTSLMYRRQLHEKFDTVIKSDMLYSANHFLIISMVGIISIVLAYFEIGIKIGLPGFIYGSIGLFIFLYGKYHDKKYSEEKNETQEVENN